MFPLKKTIRIGAYLLTLSFLTSCGGESFQTLTPIDDDDATDVGGIRGPSGKEDASDVAIVLDFSFDMTMITDSMFGLSSQIQNQLLYTIGHLNEEASVGRLDKIKISNLQKTTEADGRIRVTYRVDLPVAWGKKNAIPPTYTMKLPLDSTASGLEQFTQKYMESCVDHAAHDVDSGSMWYYYRPNSFNCTIAPTDIIETTATVSVSAINTTGKYPEYHKIWEDNALKVVAIFGKYEDGATANSDAGIAAYNNFYTKLKSTLSNLSLKTTPAEIPVTPGVAVSDITFSATLPDGKTVEVVALLVDNVRTSGIAFDSRYAELSTRADLIIYNGHSGLGANIRALANKGHWTAGQYAVVYMNGCDSYAYVDSALAQAHQLVNTDDPNGTKYLDIITNAMPSYFNNSATGTTTLIKALMAFETPKTFEQIFRELFKVHVTIVSGEQDNVYVPGYPGPIDPPPAWNGLDETGIVKRNENKFYETPTLEAGKYTVRLTGKNDADLYVRIGEAPTTELYDCRPYRVGTKETCVVDLPSKSSIHVMVRGWATSSEYRVRIAKTP